MEHGETRCEAWRNVTDDLVDEEASASNRAPASSSHEPLHPEPPPKVVSGQHSKTPKLQRMQKDQNYEDSVHKHASEIILHR